LILLVKTFIKQKTENNQHLYPLPIKMHASVANSDIKTRRNMMTFRAINVVNHSKGRKFCL